MIDPSIWKWEKGGVYRTLHADDNLMVWNPEAIDEAIEVVQVNALALKVMEELLDYLFSKVRFLSNKMKAIRTAPFD